MTRPAEVRLTNEEREDLAVALHGMTCHLATGESCGVADEYDRADAVVIGATVEGMIAARVRAAADAIEARRAEHWQRHLREHPYADASSCPGDYAAHDAYYAAAAIVRNQGVPE